MAREEVSVFVDIVRQLLGSNRTVQFMVEGAGPDIKLPGGATATIPHSVSLTARLESNGVRIDVGRPYITVKKSIFRGSLDYVSVTPERIFLSLRGLPDQTIKVEP